MRKSTKWLFIVFSLLGIIVSPIAITCAATYLGVSEGEIYTYYMKTTVSDQSTTESYEIEIKSITESANSSDVVITIKYNDRSFDKTENVNSNASTYTNSFVSAWNVNSTSPTIVRYLIPKDAKKQFSYELKPIGLAVVANYGDNGLLTRVKVENTGDDHTDSVVISRNEGRINAFPAFVLMIFCSIGTFIYIAKRKTTKI